jgi:hypothetical protein
MSEPTTTCEEMQVLVSALDTWLSAGGFLPDAWARR